MAVIIPGSQFSLSFILWFLIGFVRLSTDTLFKLFYPQKYYNARPFHSNIKLKKITKKSQSRLLFINPGSIKYESKKLAVCLPAHNEEVVIGKTIQALKTILTPKQIYVVSDGSTDKTYQKAKYEGCHVSNLIPGRGKAKALVYLIKRYRLFKRYKYIFIVDADTKIDKNFLNIALPIFNDPIVGAVFGSAQIKWQQHIIPRLKYYFISYRERLDRMLQYFLVYGQTWKYTNLSYVIPGFAVIYRSRILKQLEIDTPGLLIEDFNLAFQFHKKKLGLIGYRPSIIGWDQHPDNLLDYWKQVQRWNIGFFQTVKKNGIWPSFFWVVLGIFSLEVFLNSIFILFIPIIIVYFLLYYQLILNSGWNSLPAIYFGIWPFGNLNILELFGGLFLIDYFFTVVIGLINKKPQFIFYGIFFFFMHFVTSLILVSSIIPGFFGSSSGRWVSPARRNE